MKARISPGTRAERVDFARDERIRQQQLALPILRMSRIRRRVAVVVLYLLLVATAIVLRVGPGTWTTGWSDLMTLAAKGFAAVALLVVVLATLVGAQVVVFLVISYSIHRWTTGIETLDERERTERDRATVVAYKLLSAAVVVPHLLRDRSRGPPRPAGTCDGGGSCSCCCSHCIRPSSPCRRRCSHGDCRIPSPTSRRSRPQGSDGGPRRTRTNSYAMPRIC